MRPELPEERLLNLIKGKIKKKPEDKPLTPPVTASSGVARATKVFGRIRHSRVEFLKTVNKYLGGILIAAALYSIYVFFFSSEPGAFFMEAGPETGSVASSQAASQTDLQPQEGDYASYEAILGSKQLFHAGENDRAEEVIQSASIAGKFTLVGIMPGVNPQAIIEDKETGKTYYLYKGTSFDGGVVQEIGSGRVVLDCKGEKINLVL